RRSRDGNLGVGLFGRTGFQGDDLRVRFDRTLDAAWLERKGNTLVVSLPEEFGQVHLTGGALARIDKVEGLPPGASWRAGAGAFVLSQSAGIQIWSGGERAQVSPGSGNRVQFQVGRYGGTEGATDAAPT